MVRGLTLALALLPGAMAAAPAVPTQYFAKVTMTMPYYDLVEPISVWYDEANGLGRLDYWEGVDRYLYNSSGESYQIVPTSSDGTSSEETCFKDGQGFDPVTIFPDLTYFPDQEDGGNCTINGIECRSWTLRSPTYNETSGFDGNYTYYVKADDSTPLRFHFTGFNVVLGSHYDEYIFDYLQVEEGQPAASLFAPPASMDCQILETDDDDGGGPTRDLTKRREGPISGPLAELRALMPFGERARTHRFEVFASRFEKRYQDFKERIQRASLYGATEMYVNAMNHRRLSYWLEVNYMADWTTAEKKKLLGRKHTPKGTVVPATQSHEARLSDDELPDSIDWREKGAVTPVKDQGTCGSCWSYGATGTTEGQAFLKTGVLTPLSQQNLMDCSWPQGNDACDGGLDYRAYEWIMEHDGKLATEESYPYMNADGYCRFESSTPGDFTITGYANVTGGVSDLNDALVSVGPISVSIDATPDSFYFYAGGYYYNRECKSGIDDLDHTVLAVGYETYDGQIYTLVKNSWSVHWGMDGYVAISQKDNCCGVATQPTYVILE